jgi:hypothetical protein
MNSAANLLLNRMASDLLSVPKPAPQISGMHVENLGQSGSSRKLGIVNQIWMAELAKTVALTQRHAEQLAKSDWQVRHD